MQQNNRLRALLSGYFNGIALYGIAVTHEPA